MTDWFLKLKPWQLLLITAGPIIIWLLTILYSIFVEKRVFSPQEFWLENKIMQIIFLITGGIFYAWIWFSATFLFKYLSLNFEKAFSRFKLLHLFSGVYFALMLLSLILGLLDFESDDVPNAIFLLIHFSAMFSFLHSTYFTAKIIRSGELDREASFSDFSSYFYNLSCFHIFATSNFNLKIQNLVNKSIR